MKLRKDGWPAMIGSVLALTLVALAVGEVTFPALRWFLCGVGLLMVMLLVAGWGRPRRGEKELMRRLRRAESQRDEVERYFTALMDSVPSNIYFKDLESKFVRVNESMAHWVGAGHVQDLIGKSDHDLFKQEHAEQARQDEETIIKTGKGIEGYIEKETFPNGTEGWVLSAKLPFRNREGVIVGTLGISSDVSDMVRTSHTLERERNTLRSLIDSIPDNIYIRDRLGKYLVVNQALADFLGVGDPTLVQGMTPSDFFTKEQSKKFLKEDDEVMRTGEPVLNRKSELKNDRGEKRNLLISKVPVRDESGEIYGIVGMNRDVTEELRARQRLKQAEQQMQEIMDHSPAPIYVKALNGRYLMVNEHFQNLFGCKNREEILGKDDHEIMSDPETAQRLRQIDAEVAQKGEAIQMDEDILLPDGLHTYVSSKFPMRDYKGEIYAVGGISFDITHRKEAEESIRKINGELVEANENLTKAYEQLTMAAKMESVGRLAAGVAHEVKNPLAMIGMGLELLARRLPPEDQKAADTVERMRRGIDRAKKIVKGLVDFSSDRALNIQPVSVVKVIRDSFDLVAYEFRKANIRFKWEPNDASVLVQVDQLRMEQVFVNLLINAMHAMDGGGTITLTTEEVALEEVVFDAGSRERERPKEGDRMLRILIRDTGTGIAEESLGKLFDPFYTTKETGKGTGLGLAVSHKIVELHGGHLRIRNREDHKGAEAELILRLATKPIEV